MKSIKLIKGEDAPYLYAGYYVVDNVNGKAVALDCTEDDGTVRRALVCAATLFGIKELLAKLFGYIDSSGKYTEYPTVDLFLFRREASLGEAAHSFGFKWIYCGGEMCLPAKPIDNCVDEHCSSKVVTPEGIAEAIVGDLTPAPAVLKQKIADAIRHERRAKP